MYLRDLTAHGDLPSKHRLLHRTEDRQANEAFTTAEMRWRFGDSAELLKDCVPAVQAAWGNVEYITDVFARS